jgi:nitrogen-specific signal transduction histidine kinase/CheY-like chemotaxis protein
MDIHLSLILDAERALVEEKRANDARCVSISLSSPSLHLSPWPPPSPFSLFLTLHFLSPTTHQHHHRYIQTRRAFMKFIFHEVRTPLNSLTMGIEMIACSSNIDEADVESLEIMRSASNFMSKTLDGVLSVHKIEEGKFDLVMGPTDLSALVQSAVLTFQGTIIRKGISVQVVVSPHVPLCVLGDSARLEHVVSNLLSNAIKFSPEGGEIQLVVECLSQRFATETEKEKDKSSGSIAEISVSIHDNGPGIPLEDQSKLFNQFVQIRPLTMQAGQGSGLGLSFCKNIVTLHKGSVSVVSTPGRGSTFRFVIPFQVIESPAPTPAPAPTPTPTPQPQSYPSSSSAAPAPGYVRVSSSSAMPTPLLKSERSFVIRPGSASGPNFFDNAPSPRILVETQTPEQQQVLLPPLGSSPLATLTSSSSQRSMQPSETSEKLRPEELEVLVVDDAENNRRILMLLLVRKNIKCFGAENGRIAADLVMQDPNRFKLILMDNLMPVMNGTESCKELRRARYPYLIIGITGNVSDGDISEYHACGADMVLRKPIKPDIITKILSFWKMNPFSQWERNMTIALSLAGELAWVAKS